MTKNNVLFSVAVKLLSSEYFDWSKILIQQFIRSHMFEIHIFC